MTRLGSHSEVVPRDDNNHRKSLKQMTRVERDALFRVLVDRLTGTSWNVSLVARRLGVDRRTVTAWSKSPLLSEFLVRNDEERTLQLFAGPKESLDDFFKQPSDNLLILNAKVRWLYRILNATGHIDDYRTAFRGENRRHDDVERDQDGHG